jgi:hypothetical protein
VARLPDELERLFAADYLQGLVDRPLDELRAMRADLNRAETAVSYLRRVAQGRLDVVHSIMAGAAVKDRDLAGVVEDLAAIIGSGPPRPAGPGRLPTQMAPDLEAVEDEDLTADIDAVLGPQRLGELPTMDPAALRAISERLAELEARISAQRKELHERIDAVQGEIVSRYKSGDASPDGLLA